MWLAVLATRFPPTPVEAAYLLGPIVVVRGFHRLRRLYRRSRGVRFPGRLPRDAVEQVWITSPDRLLRPPTLALAYRDETGDVRAWRLRFARRIWGPRRAQYDRALKLFESMDPEHGIAPMDAPPAGSEAETDPDGEEEARGD